MRCHCSNCGVCEGGVSQCSENDFPGCIIKLRKSGSIEQCCFDDLVQKFVGCNNTFRDNGALSVAPYEYCCTENFCNTEQVLRSAIAALSTTVNVVSTSTSPLPSPTTAAGSYSENSGIGNHFSNNKKIYYNYNDCCYYKLLFRINPLDHSAIIIIQVLLHPVRQKLARQHPHTSTLR